MGYRNPNHKVNNYGYSGMGFNGGMMNNNVNNGGGNNKPAFGLSNNIKMN